MRGAARRARCEHPPRGMSAYARPGGFQIDAEALHLADERRATRAQRERGLGLVPVVRAQRVENATALLGLERLGKRSRMIAALELERQPRDDLPRLAQRDQAVQDIA